jgi:CheY-like chemotaxis protein
MQADKLSSIGLLAAGVAHEVNTPLAVISTYAQMLAKQISGDEQKAPLLEKIARQTFRASEIVNSLLNFSRTSATEFVPVDLNKVVRETLSLVEHQFTKSSVKVDLGLDENLTLIKGSPGKLQQVFLNLFLNARDAMESGGSQGGTLAIETSRWNGAVRVRVCDSGMGIAPENLARIFDPFFTTKLAGRGLGLAAVQGIVRSHGGTINVVSAPGRGSRFYIQLPCIGQPAGSTRVLAAIPSSREPGIVAGTVLVVEDEEVLRRAVSKMLRKERFSVLEAGDGTTGANLFRTNESTIDAVLLDLTLPGMSGREVLNELRRIRPDVKVILTTAYSQENALSAIGEHRPWSYVRKPYQFSDLLNLLRKACIEKSQARSNTAS